MTAGAAARSKGARYQVGLARHQDEIRALQRLRWRVFAEEGRAHLDTPEHGFDIDRYDAHCEHLYVRCLETEEMIGTYRILTWDCARPLGGFYSDQEFDLGALDALRPGFVELGRSCIAAEHRGGSIIALLWTGLAEFLAAGNHRAVIGCASVSLCDGGHTAAAICREAELQRPCPAHLRVWPRNPLELDRLPKERSVNVPPLVKGYLRSGAIVCGAPHWDPDFNTADLFMMLEVRALARRYARHFVKSAAGRLAA